MKLKGKIIKLGNDINTDLIIPSKYLMTTEPKELGEHCLEGLDPNLPKKLRNIEILVVGKNFGCGSSREHAVLAIKGCGIKCIIGKSFSRIFFRNAINNALVLIESAETVDMSTDNDVLEIDVNKGEIKNMTKSKLFHFKPYPKIISDIIKSGGLLNYLRSNLKCSNVKYRS